MILKTFWDAQRTLWKQTWSALLAGHCRFIMTPCSIFSRFLEILEAVLLLGLGALEIFLSYLANCGLNSTMGELIGASSSQSTSILSSDVVFCCSSSTLDCNQCSLCDSADPCQTAQENILQHCYWEPIKHFILFSSFKLIKKCLQSSKQNVVNHLKD